MFEASHHDDDREYVKMRNTRKVLNNVEMTNPSTNRVWNAKYGKLQLERQSLEKRYSNRFLSGTVQ